jgi:hypothetical protein
MVEPLIPTTSTRAEMWLVLCELSLSHPSVDVYAQMCWKWMLTFMVWPLQCAVWMEGLWYHYLHFVWLQWSKPWWLNHCFHHIYKSWGVVGFMWAESFTSWRGCILTDARLCGKWMLTYMVWPLRSAEWMVGLWPVPLSALCLLQWM